MRRYLLALGMIAGVATPTLAQTNNPTGHEKQIIDDIARKWEAGYNRKDAAAVAALCTENVVLVAPNGIAQGRDAVQKQVDQDLKSNAHDMSIDVQIAYSAGDAILSTGEWRLTFGERPIHGYWSTVSVRDGAQWKHRQDTFNIDPPPGPSK